MIYGTKPYNYYCITCNKSIARLENRSIEVDAECRECQEKWKNAQMLVYRQNANARSADYVESLKKIKKKEKSE